MRRVMNRLRTKEGQPPVSKEVSDRRADASFLRFAAKRIHRDVVPELARFLEPLVSAGASPPDPGQVVDLAVARVDRRLGRLEGADEANVLACADLAMTRERRDRVAERLTDKLCRLNDVEQAVHGGRREKAPPRAFHALARYARHRIDGLNLPRHPLPGLVVDLDALVDDLRGDAATLRRCRLSRYSGWPFPDSSEGF